MLNEFTCTCVLYITQYSENHRHTITRQPGDSFEYLEFIDLSCKCLFRNQKIHLK